MAQAPTVDINIDHVLQVFSHLRSREGDVLGARNFVAVGARMHWSMSDLQDGLDAAVSRGWLRKVNSGYELTNAGFARMP